MDGEVITIMPDLKAPPRTIEGLLFLSGQPDGDPAMAGEEGGFITYGDLRRQVRSIAGALGAAGYKRTDRIALALPNGPLLGSVILAVSSSFVCAPLNPSFRDAEFGHYLRKLRAKAVIVKKGEVSPAREVAQGMGLEVLEAREIGAAGLFELEGVEGNPTDLYFSGEGDDAFLLQTSGTTAMPKLVPLTQANICLTVHYIRNTLGLTAQDRCLNVPPLFHGFGLVSLLTTLLSGGSIACASGFSPSRFFRLMDELKPTWYPAVPPIHQSILETAGSYKDIVSRSRLRFIRSAAARLPPALMLSLEALFHAPVVEAYGMTEAFAIGSNPLPPRKRKPGSVGLPVGPEVAVMDEAGNLLCDGRVGEIVVRGPNVMRGYEDDPDENARCFINGWFRTGDLGHIDPEGYIFIDGRVKEVINRGGEKVTPNEVDDALARHPAVSEAAAFGVPHEVMGEDLAAAVVLKEGAEVSEGDLQLFVSERLAPYKVPSRIFPLKALPKGPSGKILRRKLPELMGLAEASAGGTTETLGEGLPLVAPAEDRGRIADLNRTAAPYPRHLCIHQIFEGVAARNPSRVAIRHGEIELTYGELNARANRLARYLMAEGVGAGQFVGVCIERSPDLVTSYLAVLKAGAAYVPLLLASDSTGRIASYVEGAGIRLVITRRAYEQILPGAVRKLYYQDMLEASRDLGSEDIRTDASADGAAYLLYVPSPSGRARGVCVPHRAVGRFVLAADCLSMGAKDVVALISGPDTNLAVWEVWGTLLNGAKGAIFEIRDILSPRNFERKVADEGITVLALSTPFFNLFSSEAPGAFRGLKTLIFTGDLADPAAVRGVIEGGQPQRLINAYGCTETSVFSTWHLITGKPSTEGPIPIGVPALNTKVYIMDSDLKPVPPGTEGWLYVGGDGVATGYINDPVATRDAFLPDPFTPGGTIYRTGDLARLNPQGGIEFLGRRDRQVKVHGFRVELGEVEGALRNHPAVRECSVRYVRAGGSGEKRIVAHVVPSGPSIPSMEELHRFLLPSLLEYMIPSQYIWVDVLPQQEGGGGAAVEVGVPGAGARVDRSEVIDDVEGRLLAIWEGEMGVRGITPTDNFFHMGGYSIMAVRIFSRMEKEFGVRLSLATLYRRPTVAAIAAELRRARHGAFRSLVPLHPEGGRPRLFLVHAADGEVYNYGELVKALGEDQPVYGLRAVGLHEDIPLPRSVEEMARDYISEVRAVQPHGPYHLAGWCAGAAIAFEMARQLSSAGEEVGLVGILDFEEPVTYRRAGRRAVRSTLLKETLFLGGDLLRYARKRAAGMRLRILSRVAGIERLWMRALGIIAAEEIILPGDSAPLPETWRRAILNQLRAARAYRPKRYEGVVTVFKREMLPTISSPDPADGWRGWAGGGIVVVPVRGRIHGDMLKSPSVAVTAAKIRERMDWHEGRLCRARGGSPQSAGLEARPSR